MPVTPTAATSKAGHVLSLETLASYVFFYTVECTRGEQLVAP
jgi:hypothetical protein